jgi:hypothetical protein
MIRATDIEDQSLRRLRKPQSASVRKKLASEERPRLSIDKGKKPIKVLIQRCVIETVI